jgi:hypothetical protein
MPLFYILNIPVVGTAGYPDTMETTAGLTAVLPIASFRLRQTDTFQDSS